MVCTILADYEADPLDGPLEVDVKVFPPDNRRRDIDNVLKSLLDAIEHGGVIHDDSQIADLRARKLAPMARGKVIVKIRKIEDRDAKNSNEM